MAIAIASGVGPERGLYTAIIGGFLVSALGGSRFQIGGPAGAFIVLIAAIVERQGYDGLVLATLLAGLILIAVGLLRLGTYVKYIPYPVTVGFTAGIAVIIFASQMKELFGLTLASEPAAFVPKLEALWSARTTFNLSAAAIGISGPADRLSPTALRRFSDVVVDAARGLSRALGYNPITVSSHPAPRHARGPVPGRAPATIA